MNEYDQWRLTDKLTWRAFQIQEAYQRGEVTARAMVAAYRKAARARKNWLAAIAERDARNYRPAFEVIN